MIDQKITKLRIKRWKGGKYYHLAKYYDKHYNERDRFRDLTG
jgi:hypothetical protein